MIGPVIVTVVTQELVLKGLVLTSATGGAARRELVVHPVVSLVLRRRLVFRQAVFVLDSHVFVLQENLWSYQNVITCI